MHCHISMQQFLEYEEFKSTWTLTWALDDDENLANEQHSWENVSFNRMWSNIQMKTCSNFRAVSCICKRRIASPLKCKALLLELYIICSKTMASTTKVGFFKSCFPMHEPQNNFKIFYHILQFNPFSHYNTAQTSPLIIHKTEYDHFLL